MHKADVRISVPTAAKMMERMLRVYLSAKFTSDLGDDSYIVEKGDHGDETQYVVKSIQAYKHHCLACIEAITVVEEMHQQLGLTSDVD